MIPHNDPCLNPDLNSELNRVTTPVTSNFNGEYTIAALDLFDAEFRRSIVAEASSNVLVKMVNKYGDDFYSSLAGLNDDFLERKYVASEVPSFEILSQRLKGDRKITAFEYAQFINDYNYTPYSATDSYNSTSRRFLSELDSFYRGGFQQSIMGSFCSIIPNIFAAIDGFFDLVGEIQGLITDVFEFLNKIKNNEDPIKALFEKIKVKALIEAVKKKVEDAVKGVIDKVKNIIENFSVENIMGQIETFVNEKIVKKITKIKDDILGFFSEENINKIKDKVKGLIDYAVSVFENPSLEEIFFMVYKFCAFVTGVEGLINGLKAPLDDFSNRYEEVFGTLANASNRITGEAIRAGAIRFDNETRKEKINNQQEIQKEVYQEQTAVDEPTVTQQQAETLAMPIDIAPPEPPEFEGLPSWEDLVSGSDPNFAIQGGWVDALGRPGWNEVDSEVKIMLVRLQRKFNKRLIINSAWRSEQYNRKIGGADQSQHLSGKALDITWDGFKAGSDDIERFILMAQDIGFDAFGRYDNFVHIDNRGFKAVWGNEPPSNWNYVRLTRQGAREIVRAGGLARGDTAPFRFVDVDTYRIYEAKWIPDERGTRTGKDEFGNEITTTYGGQVTMRLIS